ncbi:pre-peptidase C-terminal domain-containing protein [Aquincola sp. S2]|uniref:Pre-peptidase C-terminal domain-containing protein n=1 Tax=Pseudaquabacterium terrae TaxID=2732868 RepID=A0ABX2EP50_9BURK|nr:pre-peptidase C-terminal domain-containing protein [Aquabacterium terrae]NRF70349.1 pre-peptidase C-terminal domain-containing protein [Aquabacterium terrae]
MSQVLPGSTPPAAGLPLAAGAADDHPDTTGDNVTIAIGGAAQPGVIGVAGDIDRFRVELGAGQRYRFQLEGALYTSELVLRDSNGSSIARDTSGSKYGPTQIDFTAPSSGTYYLDAAGPGRETGNYTVRASLTSPTVVTPPPDPVTPADDYPASSSTNGVVIPNGPSASGQLERWGDVDYFKVVLEANATYDFSLQGIGGTALQDTFLRVHADDNRELASDDDGAGTKKGGSRLSFTAPASGTYYLEVSSDVGQVGGYSLSATHDDFPASSATAGVVRVDGPAVSGALERPGDSDWLRLDLRAGVLIQLGMEGLSRDVVSLLVQTPTGDASYGLDAVTREPLSYLPPVDGSYYLIVSPWGGNATGSYSLSATTVPDDHPSSMATTGTVITNGAKSTGRIDAPADTDFFKVALVGGTSYRFSLAGTDSSLDTYLRLLGPDGSELAANDDAGSKSSSSALTFMAPSTGTYYLEASGNGRLTGGYQLSAVTALSVIEATPVNGATDVARSANLVLSFDRPVQSHLGFVNIQTSPDGGIVQRISISDTSQVSITGPLVTINPAQDLAAGIRYYVSIDNGALKDADGNRSVGMEHGQALTFSTLAGNRAPIAADHALAATQGLTTTGRLPAALDADADSTSYLIHEHPRHGWLVLEADGRYTYEAAIASTGSDQFRFSVKDSQGGSNVYTATVNVAALPVVQGTAQAETLAAAPGSKRYLALEGNDRVATGPGRDVVDGGAGTDTVVVAVARGAATLQRHLDGGWTVGTAPADTDHLIGVERLQFSDRSTALDLGGAAGQVARVVGAVFGTTQLDNAALVGRYLALADTGAGGEELVTRALADPLFLSLAGSRSNDAVVGHVYANLVGHAAAPTEVAYFSSLITGGAYTQASLLWWAAGLDLTAQRIGLTGLAAEGLDFLPG